MIAQVSQAAFDGAKLALFVGNRLLVIERDDTPSIPWPGYLDLPGGGRAAGETAEACVLRETYEEVGLLLLPAQLVYRRFYPRPLRGWFFAAHLPEDAETRIVFGNEGRSWRLVQPTDFIANEMAVPHFRERVRAYLKIKSES